MKYLFLIVFLIGCGEPIIENKIVPIKYTCASDGNLYLRGAKGAVLLKDKNNELIKCNTEIKTRG